MVLSVGVGILLALARMSKPPVSWLAAGYINVFRGVPALVSVLWVYFGVSLVIGINFTVFQSGRDRADTALQRLHRGDLPCCARGDPARPARGRPRGRHDPLRVFVQITLPQATKIAIPNIGSMFIGMVKDTSVFTIIGLLEVVRVTQNINSITFQPFVLYTAAAGLYVIAAFAIDFVFRAIEKSLATPPRGRIADAPRPAAAARRAVVRDYQGFAGRHNLSAFDGPDAVSSLGTTAMTAHQHKEGREVTARKRFGRTSLFFGVLVAAVAVVASASAGTRRRTRTT